MNLHIYNNVYTEDLLDEFISLRARSHGEFFKSRLEIPKCFSLGPNRGAPWVSKTGEKTICRRTSERDIERYFYVVIYVVTFFEKCTFSHIDTKVPEGKVAMKNHFRKKVLSIILLKHGIEKYLLHKTGFLLH